MDILSGLSLFLYGMQLMSQSLKKCMNSYTQHILITFVNHKYYSLMLGVVLTAMMQSSSAMTLMLIGFLNSQLITLENAIWILMGANVGTTITGQMMALDISKLAPFIAIFGVILLFTRYQTIGEVIVGLGLLFIGLDILQQGLSAIHIDIFFKVSHPIIMILYGFILTSIIQSSSASIGLLQSLVTKSLIPFNKAVYLIFGFNIGSTMTGVLASLVSHRDAKRLALFHLLMNSIGTILFYILCCYTPFIEYFATIVINPMQKVAHMHTLFNIITTLLTILINQYILKIVYFLLPDKHMLFNQS